MSKIIRVGNKVLEIDNKKGTAELVAEMPLENTRVRKSDKGWHVTFTGEPKRKRA